MASDTVTELNEEQCREALRHEPGRADLMHRLGVFAARREDWPNAVEHLGNAADAAPDRPRYHLDLGKAQFLAGKPKSAIESLRTALRLEPANVQAHLLLAGALRTEGQLESAETHCRDAVALDPNNAGAKISLATLAAERGAHELALSHALKAWECGPTNPDSCRRLGELFRQLGEFRDAEAAYRQALAAEDTPGTRIALGDVLLAREQPTAAADEWRAALEQAPDLAGCIALTDRFWQQHLKEDAGRACRRALKLAPDHPTAHLTYAEILQAGGDGDEALAHCRRAVEIRPDYVEAHLKLGLLHEARTDWEAAEAAYREALTLRPGEAEVHRALARALAARNEPEEAIGHLREALSLAPERTDARLDLANLLREAGDPDAAEASAREVFEVEPDSPRAHRVLAEILHDRHQPVDALAHCRRALELAPEDAASHLVLAVLLRWRRRYKAAEASAREAARLRPQDIRPWLLIAQLQAHQNHIDEARATIEQALALDPDNGEARIYLANTFRLQGRHDECESICRSVLLEEPADLGARMLLGISLTSRGESEAGLAEMLELVKLDPKNPRSYYNCGQILEEIGFQEAAAWYHRVALALDDKFKPARIELSRLALSIGDTKQYRELLGDKDEAELPLDFRLTDYESRSRYREMEALLEPMIEAGSRRPMIAMAWARLQKALKRPEAGLHLVEELLERPELSHSTVTMVHHTLGDLYDTLGRYDEAFAHHREAAERRRHRVAFNPDDNTRRTDNNIAFFTPEQVRRLPRAPQGSELPVFVVGMPRSGTTLVEQILDAHPDAHGAGELELVNELVETLPARLRSAQPYPDCVAELSANVAEEMAREYLDKVRAIAGDARRCVDKMPGNYSALGLIAILFPRARVIHCVRHPLDTCLSCYFTNFGTGHFYSFDLENLGLVYRNYHRLMAHWKAVLDIPILDVVYEDLVDEPEPHIRRIIEFAGLDWDSRCLEFYRSDRVVATASRGQVSQPIYQSAKFRHRHYEAHLGALRSALGEVLKD